MSKEEIAVGYQHRHTGMQTAFELIYKKHGVIGLWRGVTSAMARVTVGSASQLTTFAASKEYMEKYEVSQWNYCHAIRYNAIQNHSIKLTLQDARSKHKT